MALIFNDDDEITCTMLMVGVSTVLRLIFTFEKLRKKHKMKLKAKQTVKKLNLWGKTAVNKSDRYSYKQK